MILETSLIVKSYQSGTESGDPVIILNAADSITATIQHYVQRGDAALTATVSPLISTFTTIYYATVRCLTAGASVTVSWVDASGGGTNEITVDGLGGVDVLQDIEPSGAFDISTTDAAADYVLHIFGT